MRRFDYSAGYGSAGRHADQPCIFARSPCHRLDGLCRAALPDSDWRCALRCCARSRRRNLRRAGWLRLIAWSATSSIKKGVPSASIAIVADGSVIYRKAYGTAQIFPHRAASAAMRYGIGSISKEFLAAALLMLESKGRIKLDDKAGRYIANLGAAGDATLRQLLSHTAGIRDYYPQDFVFADMLKPITRDQLLDRWARQPLDFGRATIGNTAIRIRLRRSRARTVAGQSLVRFSPQPHFRAAWNEQRHRHRQRPIGRAGRRGLHRLRTWPAAAGRQRGSRLAVRRGRTGDDRGGSRAGISRSSTELC